MSEDHNVTLAQRVVEEIWNSADLDLADELFTPTYINHGGLIPDLVRGPEAIKIAVALYRTAFPDLQIRVEHLMAEKNLLMVRWMARSKTHEALTGFARTEQPSTVTGMTLCRLSGGKIAESWTSWDTGAVLSRVGVTGPSEQPRP